MVVFDLKNSQFIFLRFRCAVLFPNIFTHLNPLILVVFRRRFIFLIIILFFREVWFNFSGDTEYIFCRIDPNGTQGRRESVI